MSSKDSSGNDDIKFTVGNNETGTALSAETPAFDQKTFLGKSLSHSHGRPDVMMSRPSMDKLRRLRHPSSQQERPKIKDGHGISVDTLVVPARAPVLSPLQAEPIKEESNAPKPPQANPTFNKHAWRNVSQRYQQHKSKHSSQHSIANAPLQPPLLLKRNHQQVRRTSSSRQTGAGLTLLCEQYQATQDTTQSQASLEWDQTSSVSESTSPSQTLSASKSKLWHSLQFIVVVTALLASLDKFTSQSIQFLKDKPRANVPPINPPVALDLAVPRKDRPASKTSVVSRPRQPLPVCNATNLPSKAKMPLDLQSFKLPRVEILSLEEIVRRQQQQDPNLPAADRKLWGAGQPCRTAKRYGNGNKW